MQIAVENAAVVSFRMFFHDGQLKIEDLFLVGVRWRVVQVDELALVSLKREMNVENTSHCFTLKCLTYRIQRCGEHYDTESKDCVVSALSCGVQSKEIASWSRHVTHLWLTEMASTSIASAWSN